MEEPKVLSVCLITFNHERYIRDALEGIFNQKMDFRWELIIADDFSTDKTREIICEYQERYPEIIRLIFQEKNVGPLKNWMDLVSAPTGKYVAYLEGDDKWTDPLKTKKQVGFLEANPEYGFTCGGFTALDVDKRAQEFLKPNVDTKFENGFEITIERFWNDWCVQSLTFLYRNKLFEYDEFSSYGYQYPLDVHFYYHLIRQQKGFYFTELFGVQNVNSHSVYSCKNLLDRSVILYKARRDLYRKHNKDKYLKAKLFGVASLLFVEKGFIAEREDLRPITLFLDMIRSMQNWNDFKHFALCIFNSRKMREISDVSAAR